MNNRCGDINKSDLRVRDFEFTTEQLRKLYIQGKKSKDFWSRADKIYFEDQWTKALKELLSQGNISVLTSFRHRLELEEESEEGVH